MKKKMLGTLFSIVMLVALAVTPALAQATPTLMEQWGNEEERPVDTGEKLNLSLTGTFEIPWLAELRCSDAEITAEVTENPGASAEIIASEFSDSGPNGLCPLNPSADWYFDIENFDATLNFAEGEVAFDDLTMDIVIYHGDPNPTYNRTCGYEWKTAAASFFSAAPEFWSPVEYFDYGLDFEMDEPKLTYVDGYPACMASMSAGTGTFLLTTQYEWPVTLAE